MWLDKQARAKRDREFARFMARMEEIERESDSRRATSGEPGTRLLIAVDQDKRVSIFPFDGPPPPPTEED
jgi:hypothetical protein